MFYAHGGQLSVFFKINNLISYKLVWAAFIHYICRHDDRSFWGEHMGNRIPTDP